MNMKRLILLVLCSILIYSSANAESDDPEHKEWGISLSCGEGKENIGIYRLGFQKDYGVKWFKRENSYLSGFFELSYNYWHYTKSDDIHGIALSPVFAYYFGNKASFFRPYIAGGIGATFIDRYRIRDRNLGSNFQFEDRIGIGVIIERFDINFSYFHYSNAGLKLPNSGIDIFLVSGAFRF
jgi:lipid A 3-O-deacylase